MKKSSAGEDFFNEGEADCLAGLFPDLQFQGLSGGVADDVDAAPEAGGLESGLEVRERCAGVQADVPELGAHQVEYPVAARGPCESICHARGSGAV